MTRSTSHSGKSGSTSMTVTRERLEQNSSIWQEVSWLVTVPVDGAGGRVSSGFYVDVIMCNVQFLCEFFSHQRRILSILQSIKITFRQERRKSCIFDLAQTRER